MVDLPGKELAQELLQQSREESRHTPMAAVIEAARQGQFAEEQGFRLIGWLWTLERLFYYIYGGWGQGLEINDFPPSVKYLFARQIMDESTQEMLYLDLLLRKRWVKTQKEAFRHPYGQFVTDSALAYYAFSLRNLATYPHTVRIAALNLGAKVLELGWMEQLAEVMTDKELQGVFTSQFVENRSHINMGRRIVEEYISKPFDADLCRWACRVARRDYSMYLQELSDLVLGRETVVEARAAPLRVSD
ncbi:MAG TPA: hypothetical protein VNN62_11500 [Methylomirabilota bacterium]|jgi:hypothetical protein|nr:hypothetical protein [Methylomirabilota bacterium]